VKTEPRQCACKAGERGLEVPVPTHIRAHLDRCSPTIDIDPCIVRVIEELWHHHIVTTGCCCGHNKTEPSVIIGSGENTTRVNQLLRKVSPGRAWTVYQWRLMDVSEGAQ
jgi:hypothetical protein